MKTKLVEKIRARNAAEWTAPDGRNPYEPMTLDGLAAIKREYNDRTWKPGEEVASDGLTEAEVWKHVHAPRLERDAGRALTRRWLCPHRGEWVYNGTPTGWDHFMLVGPGRKPWTVRVRRCFGKKGAPVRGAEPGKTVHVMGTDILQVGHLGSVTEILEGAVSFIGQEKNR